MYTTKFLSFLICVLCLIVFLPGCKDKEPQSPAAYTVEQLPDYLLAHTSGVISRNSPIAVTLNSAPADPPKVAMTVTPTAGGKITMNGRQILFTPDQPWAGGQNYRVKLEVEGEEDYEFSFGVPERRLEVVTDGIYVPDPNQPERVELTGTLRTNDGATLAEMTDLLTITRNGKPLTVNVTEGPDRNTFDFVAGIDDRGEQASTVLVSYDGKAGGFAGAVGSTEVSIAGTKDFTLLSVVPSDDRSHAVLRFSNPVDGRQDMKGLISFTGGLNYTTTTDGNLLRVYPSGDNNGTVTLKVSGQLAAMGGTKLGQSTEHEIQFGQTQPGLRTVAEGTIMPTEGKRLFTFEAVGLNAVYLEILEIYSGNVLQFLQDGSLDNPDQDWTIQRVGQTILRKVIPLSELAGAASANRWSRYAIDLGEFVDADPASIYQVRLAFGMEHVAGGCNFDLEAVGAKSITERLADKDEFNPGFKTTQSLMGDYYGIYGYYQGFSWDDRDEPCSPAYFHRERYIVQNVISSNLGLIAKRNPDRSTIVFATDLLTAGPVGGAEITAYSYTNQELFRGTTDGDGRLAMMTDEEPAVIVARKGENVAYLDINGNSGLATGRFAVGGTTAVGGMKGAFFAERGVWRPGDSVFLNFVLQDKQQRLPVNYPVEFTLTDARGRTVEQRNVMPAFGAGFYPLAFATGKADVTGLWTATVKAGGQTYNRDILVETVKPNRLAIDLDLPEGGLQPGQQSLGLEANWLYGAPGANLRATVNMDPSARNPDFPDFGEFIFHDPARRITNAEEVQIFDGKLDANGRATVQLKNAGGNLPGPLQLRLATKVFEAGGNFSTDNQRIPYDPYRTYAGVRIPRNEWGSKRVSQDGSTQIELSAVNPSGQGVANRRLTVGIYRVDWRYWWQDDNDNVARFSSSRHTNAIASMDATTNAGGRASVPVSVDDWGRYLIRVCDQDGHCTGDYFYAGYADESDDRESASLLRLKANEERVDAGERVTIKVPTSTGGKLLVSLETGVGSIEQFWVDAQNGETEVSFATDERMVPTVYANVTYLQPYAQTTNDRPVRLFGVVPIEVIDAQTVLEPVVAVADEWKPEQTVEVKVSEANDQAMTYTIAVVDEGLLGLTRFQTPDLHADFYGKEALGVRTYDIYEHVMSSIDGEFGRVLGIGGGGELNPAEEESANRFVAVVRHLGPFQLKGGTATHRVDLPNYVGAIRVMVVAVGKNAFGSDSETVPVRQPLMVLPTLPRVLGPGETVNMPVDVFAMDAKVRNVNVSVAESAGLANVGGGAQVLSFSQTGNKLAYFPVTVSEATGIARFDISANGNGESSSQQIEIDVRHPNTSVTRTKVIDIAPGASQTISYDNFGLPGTREASVELSGLPAMDLQRHLKYLLRYPYGCAEQTISPAFAQVFLDKVVKLDQKQETDRRKNVAAGIDALRKFRTSGGIAYWPGGAQPHPWATNYALHFLLEAERAGFGVPYDLKEELITVQQRAAAGWNRNDGMFYASLNQRALDQAYRLYGLAIAGKAEIGAMNRLRGIRNELPTAARYQLAAAYALIGRASEASELMQGIDPNVKAYRELGYTFGSQIRDMAIILEAQLASGDKSAAAKQVFRLAERIGDRKWLNTQEAAFAFVSLGKLADSADNPIEANFTPPSGSVATVGASSGVYAIDLPTVAEQGTYSVQNTGQSTLYVTTTVAGKPRPGEEKPVSNGLRLSVSYQDAEGKAVDVSRLTSGTDFTAVYSVTNPGTTGGNYRQLALQTLLPSGWEVGNTRLAGDIPSGNYDYQDIRDDRVHTFFNLNAGETKTFTFNMTATYAGRYYLPTQVAEAMYDRDLRGEVKGKWVEVVK